MKTVRSIIGEQQWARGLKWLRLARTFKDEPDMMSSIFELALMEDAKAILGFERRSIEWIFPAMVVCIHNGDFALKASNDLATAKTSDPKMIEVALILAQMADWCETFNVDKDTLVGDEDEVYVSNVATVH